MLEATICSLKGPWPLPWFRSSPPCWMFEFVKDLEASQAEMTRARGHLMLRVACLPATGAGRL